jgi:hypothetical protein
MISLGLWIIATGIAALSFECLARPWCSLGSQDF